MPLKLISLNIEGHRHLQERVLPFLQQEQPDVICLQEVFESDLPVLQEHLNMEGHYLPMANVTESSVHMPHALGNLGLAQFSRLPILDQRYEYYVGLRETIPIFYLNNNANSMNRGVLWLELEQEGKKYTVATTHFTWSAQGEASDLQRANLKQMFAVLDQLPEVILTGDFNAPRGGEIFQRLSERYRDNIPASVKTTIDPELHKAGKLELVVDGVFTSPEFFVKEVRLVPGVSDHQALIALVERG